MGRPSNKEKRAEEILQTYESCVAKYGIEGTTLELLASEAGLARALIRHHVGNREALQAALIERFFARSDAVIAQLAAELAIHYPTRSKERLKTLVDWFFDPTMSDPTFTRIAMALISISIKNPDLEERITNWVTLFASWLEDEIKQAMPTAEPEACRAVAAGILGIYFNIDSFASVPGLQQDFAPASKQACLRLIDSLDA